MSNRYYLALDGGGTKTSVLCVDEAGVVQGQGQSGPTNLTSTTVGAASFNLREGIRQAIESLPADREIPKLVMGLAGMDSQLEHDTALELFLTTAQSFGVPEVQLVNDSVIALANGTTAANAIVLLSGTGANCRGRNEEGEEATAGGRDYLLSDQGSGYDIGRQVLYAAVKSFDGRGPKTQLEARVCQHFQVDSIDLVKPAVYQPPLLKPEVSAVSLLCFQAVQDGDQVAQEILEEAASELAAHVVAVATRLQLTERSFDLVLAGSIATDPYMKDLLCPRVHSVCAQCQAVVPEKPPVWGAVKLALAQD